MMNLRNFQFLKIYSQCVAILCSNLMKVLLDIFNSNMLSPLYTAPEIFEIHHSINQFSNRKAYY